ncbi:MAG: diacylglycerol kinase family protein [Prolixibacteraceae bacterium]|jgi:YegS/Rv2252/BmrU family lipid kinase|nr:diacylglycerol kinase family lipid kinase [Prolixibacteraceae bacterium]MDI9563578.1 diacylglycerol kinase family lipid kinase [Bacteroidota bacterium]NLT00132.1 diacylglycerol kinase family lipid kinase [Bacteroidales bacterium]OQB78983.1 MAG: putative lipid kinase YtlR [Bacteroidetes bacterium ADurb.Bin123]HNU78634.1 diacylglycerol kinase family lipid kinase [Prolixibacteraceae bacterium]
MKGKWFVIVNPNAGKQKGKHDWKRISGLLYSAGIEYQSHFTEHRGHAIVLAREYISAGYRKIIVVGGDGTLNEVVNGIFTQSAVAPAEIILGMIPVGTGNDWCRMFSIPGDYHKAIAMIKREKIFIQDVGLLEYANGSGNKELRYFVNIAGMGFDALVLEKTNKDKEKGKGSPLMYMINIFTSLFSFRTTRTKIKIDGDDFSPEVFSMTAAIGKFNGGGLKQAPEAVADDGLFDLTIIRPISKFKVIRNVMNLMDGSFTKLPEVSSFKTANIQIESVPDLYAEADGESLGHTPFRFSLLPSALRIIRGEPEQS